MAVPIATGICAEPGCETPVSKRSKSGCCRLCAVKRMHRDPAYQAAHPKGIRAADAVPGAMQRRIASRVELRLGWCPVPLRPRYFHLCQSKRFPAAEARRLIEAEIPGTLEHARRQIANAQDAARIRDARWRAEAY